MKLWYIKWHIVVYKIIEWWHSFLRAGAVTFFPQTCEAQWGSYLFLKNQWFLIDRLDLMSSKLRGIPIAWVFLWVPGYFPKHAKHNGVLTCSLTYKKRPWAFIHAPAKLQGIPIAWVFLWVPGYSYRATGGCDASKLRGIPVA